MCATSNRGYCATNHFTVFNYIAIFSNVSQSQLVTNRDRVFHGQVNSFVGIHNPTRQFLTGFNASVVTIYWVGLGVMLLAFVLTWFFRVPPLRTRSALQERADGAREGHAPSAAEGMLG